MPTGDRNYRFNRNWRLKLCFSKEDIAEKAGRLNYRFSKRRLKMKTVKQIYAGIHVIQSPGRKICRISCAGYVFLRYAMN
jgi:hypothetical protein